MTFDLTYTHAAGLEPARQAVLDCTRARSWRGLGSEAWGGLKVVPVDLAEEYTLRVSLAVRTLF